MDANSNSERPRTAGLRPAAVRLARTHGINCDVLTLPRAAPHRPHRPAVRGRRDSGDVRGSGGMGFNREWTPMDANRKLQNSNWGEATMITVS